jgi:hypothetical protein
VTRFVIYGWAVTVLANAINFLVNPTLWPIAVVAAFWGGALLAQSETYDHCHRIYGGRS